jgi:hypothetical protein
MLKILQGDPSALNLLHKGDLDYTKEARKYFFFTGGSFHHLFSIVIMAVISTLVASLPSLSNLILYTFLSLGVYVVLNILNQLVTTFKTN